MVAYNNLAPDQQRKIKIILILASMLLLLGACTSVTEKLDPNVFYKRDIAITYNKQVFTGVAALPYAPNYNLKFQSSGKMDLITIASCHGEKTDEKAGKSGLFIDGESYEYFHSPLQEDMVCDLDVGVYEAVLGRHGWAHIIFNSPKYSLGASLYCNGAFLGSSGVGICQSRTGLYQSITFKEPVKAGFTAPCPKLETKDDLTFVFPMPQHECNYYFSTKDGKLSRLVTVGYDAVPLRKVN